MLYTYCRNTYQQRSKLLQALNFENSLVDVKKTFLSSILSSHCLSLSVLSSFNQKERWLKKCTIFLSPRQVVFDAGRVEILKSVLLFFVFNSLTTKASRYFDNCYALAGTTKNITITWTTGSSRLHLLLYIVCFFFICNIFQYGP